MAKSKTQSAAQTFTPVGVPDFAVNYEINPIGKVRSIKTGAILKVGRPGGSEFVVLTVNGFRKPFSVKTLLKDTFGDSLPISRDERNRRICQALKAEGATQKAVAQQFHVSVDTVRKAVKEAK